MKFKIRYADQIVGVLLIAAVLALLFIIFMLGKKQRWFTRDPSYKTYSDSAAGLSSNMAVQYKGFTIGNVKSFKLTEDNRVEVIFVIHKAYTDRVTRGSLVDINVSPIGLGSQFRFHPGLGTERLEAGALVPHLNSPEGKQLIQNGLAYLPASDDSISLLVSQINKLVADIDVTVGDLNTALKGTDETSLGRTLLGVEALPGTIKQTVDGLAGDIDPILAEVNRITTDIHQVTEKLAEPDGLVGKVLDGDGSVYASLEASLKSLSGILQDVDKTTSLLPANVAAILMDARKALKSAEDVLTALTNNPLLKGGIPAQVQTQSGGTNLRDISF